MSEPVILGPDGQPAKREHVCGLQGYQRGREPDPPCPGCAPLPRWVANFREGELVPVLGWWFRVAGIANRGEEYALVLEPTGERTKGRKREERTKG